MTDREIYNKLAHSSFPQPIDTSVRVWRYMDLAKFIWLVEYKKLWLSRLDLLKDHHEGSITRLSLDTFEQWLRQRGLLLGDFPQMLRNMRTSTYVNCWHLVNTESEAMWRLYCPGDHGVAIQTSYKKLSDSINHDANLFLGCITYIDYESGGFPIGNMFLPVMHKRESFAHEKEVRLVKTLYEFIGLPIRIGPPGITIDWQIESVIDAIYINPYAPEYYYDVIQATIRKFVPGFENRIFWSKMRSEPVY